MIYRLLRETPDSDRCAVLYPEGLSIAALNKGEPLYSVEEPVVLYLSADGSDLTDFVESPVVLVSDRMKMVFERLGVDSVQFFRATLQREHSDVERAGYWLANIIGRVACADPLRSTYELVDGEPVALETLCIDPDRALDLSVFRLAEDPRMIVVSSRTQDALRSAPQICAVYSYRIPDLTIKTVETLVAQPHNVFGVVDLWIQTRHTFLPSNLKSKLWAMNSHWQETLWVSMLGSLAAEAKNGEQKLFDGAGHMLQLERPHEVAEVILNLVASSER